MADNPSQLPVKLANTERAAVLLMAVGEVEAAAILKHLSPKDVQRVGTAMAKLGNVSKTQLETVVGEFFTNVRDQTGLGIANDAYIRKMLVSALGDEKATTLIDRILMGGSTKGLDTLKWMDGRSIAELIRYEHPQIQAIVISYLESDQAAEVLQYMDQKVQLDVLMRIAELDTIQPSAIQELNDILERQFTTAANAPTKGFGGLKTTADIINFLDSSNQSRIMEGIKSMDENLEQSIQDLMFVFDNIKDIDDRGIQTLLREVSSEILILALKGADDVLQNKIFGNMSKRASELLRDDLESKGPVKLSDVENAQKEILTVARRLADSGDIILGGKGGEQMVG